MPVFEYECRKCGARFEALVRSASQAVLCEKCGAPDPVRKVSRFAPASSSPKNACPAAGSCPSAESAGGCGCGGCCHHHHS